jgi:hypothetical protein
MPAAVLPAVLLSCVAPAIGSSLVVSSLPAGYTTSSIELGQPYAGALAADPSNLNRLYAAVGFFGNQSILRVDAASGTTTTVASGIGNIGGLAVLSNGDLAFTENGTSQSIFRARDLTADGDFLDPGEVTQLIAPILADSGFGFTGAQIAVAPAGNAANIPAGSLVIQTADGGTSGELLVVQNPTSVSPGYYPAGAAFFSGFGYNGGIAFTPGGNVLVGESVYPSGRIYGLVNTNADDRISSGESHVIVDTSAIPNGIADVAASQDGRVFFAGNGSAFGAGDARIYSFPLPANLLTGSGTPSPFAVTNAGYVSTVRLDDPAKNFTAGASSNTARMYVGGADGFFASFTNLVAIRPQVVSCVQDWSVY